MNKLLAATILFFPYLCFANTITGLVKDNKGNVLPFASILIKGTGKGTTANSKGIYNLQIDAGEYVVVCQHVGFKTEEKKISVNKIKTELNFELQEQQYNLKEVVVTSGAEDPAYEIIRNTIKKREEHLNEIKKFQCKVYIKGQLQLRDYPKKFLGDKVDFEDGDTSKRKMIFLSETVAKYSVEDQKKKIEVVSTKVSGRSDGFGFSNPQVFSFYENIISLGRGLNPRGFISPISNNALNFYRYKFEGTFYENGIEINRIKVIPRRKYEPLFSGYINIIEGEWRLQSVQLKLLKEQQMQFLDTLEIEQLYMPLKNVWVIKQQVVSPAGKFFGFDFFGNFVQVYEQYDIEPSFKNKFFNNTILTFADSSNKKSLAYWDSIRPLPLLDAEIKDYKKKDSLEQLRKDPKYLDSLDRIRNKITFNRLFLLGQTFDKEKTKETFSFDPLIAVSGIYYNPVEGRFFNYGMHYSNEYKKHDQLNINPNFRYGFSNKHFNFYINSSYAFGKKDKSMISVSGGKKVFQFNNNNPISEINNALSSYYWQHNYMKIYEAAFAKISFAKPFGNGFSTSASIQFQDRKPLENTIDSLKGKAFSPNYPTELISSNINAHKAFIAIVGLTWHPGAKYIEFPDRKINIGSKYPTFNISFTQGVNGLLGSDVDYSQWHFSINDNLNLKLGGRISYRIGMGGFINTNKIYAPDYQHYLGNQTAIASQYLNSFQLLPYYQFSNTEKFYSTGHIEYHLDGLLTNKIPLFRKLNWFFVLGGNALYINKNSHYYEAFFSIENIFKIGRIDAVQGFQQNGVNTTGIRFSLPLFIGSGGNTN
ncbi:hypothetical protein GALL_55670 [mine drainage metagenome]|uniref:TonB-dependent receptor SusC n=1 Tax=mine drainage metagenome TaxID=410659 RepID=A0A1J5TME6_9ZZZZ